MSNIPGEFKYPPQPQILSTPVLEEPDEFCPIALLWLCRRHWNWNIEQFSWVFGWNHDTIRKWAGGRQKPSKQARIRAATLKQLWKI